MTVSLVAHPVQEGSVTSSTAVTFSGSGRGLEAPELERSDPCPRETFAAREQTFLSRLVPLAQRLLLSVSSCARVSTGLLGGILVEWSREGPSGMVL